MYIAQGKMEGSSATLTENFIFYANPILDPVQLHGHILFRLVRGIVWGERAGCFVKTNPMRGHNSHRVVRQKCHNAVRSHFTSYRERETAIETKASDRNDGKRETYGEKKGKHSRAKTHKLGEVNILNRQQNDHCNKQQQKQHYFALRALLKM